MEARSCNQVGVVFERAGIWLGFFFLGGNLVAIESRAMHEWRLHPTHKATRDVTAVR